MKPDTSPAIETQAEARWVEAALVRSLMRAARNWQFLSLLLVFVMLGVLWNDASAWALTAWAIVAIAVSAVRVWMLARYARLPAAAQLPFFSRWRFLWPLSALVGAMATALFFDRAPLADQFICWLFMAGMAMFSSSVLIK